MNPSVEITNAMLLECLRKQVYEFRSQYEGFIKHHVSITGYHRYAIHRHYESEIGDLAPQMISNALNIQLIILSEAAGSFTIMKVSPCYNPDGLPLFLHKNGKHYNGISPKLSKSYWLSCQTPPNDKNDKQAEHKARAQLNDDNSNDGTVKFPQDY